MKNRKRNNRKNKFSLINKRKKINNYKNQNNKNENANNEIGVKKNKDLSNSNGLNKKKFKFFFHKRKNNNKQFKNKNLTQSQENLKKEEKISYEICPICNKEINQPFYAIKHNISGFNAHFECIQNEIAEKEKLQTDEKIYYFGSGTFGIVKEKRQRGKIKFTTIKRIKYEEKK